MPGYGASYWAERTPKARRRSYPAFRGDTVADAVVIGGGLTGCTAAYVFASAGLRVLLVEAGRLASAGTAGGVGAIVPQPDTWFRRAEASAGLRAARAAWTLSRRSALDLRAALVRLGVRCDLTPAPVVINARDAAQAQMLRREQAARRAAGIVSPWLTPASATAEIGTESSGALRLNDGFVMDPVRAALGLATAAGKKGAQIFEQSPVRRTRFTRRHADVIFPNGSIRTRLIYVATGGPGTLFGSLRRHVREEEAYGVVTEPLSAAMRRATGGREAVLTEAAEKTMWLRWLPDGRALLLGAPAAPTPPRQRDKVVVVRTADLMYQLSVRYPVISGLPARWGWQVPVVATADGLPWIGAHRNYPFHYFAMAFGAHADGLAWHAARAALRHLNGDEARDDRAFGFLR